MHWYMALSSMLEKLFIYSSLLCDIGLYITMMLTILNDLHYSCPTDANWKYLLLCYEKEIFFMWNLEVWRNCSNL